MSGVEYTPSELADIILGLEGFGDDASDPDDSWNTNEQAGGTPAASDPDEPPVVTRRAGRPKRAPDPEILEDVLSMYNSGVSMAAIGRSHGVSSSVVKRWLIDAGARDPSGKAHKPPPSVVNGRRRVAGPWSAAEPPTPRQAKKNLLESKRDKARRGQPEPEPLPQEASPAMKQQGHIEQLVDDIEDLSAAYNAGVDDPGLLRRLEERILRLETELAAGGRISAGDTDRVNAHPQTGTPPARRKPATRPGPAPAPASRQSPLRIGEADPAAGRQPSSLKARIRFL